LSVQAETRKKNKVDAIAERRKTAQGFFKWTIGEE